MNYPPIGINHSSACDEALKAGEVQLLCDACKAEMEYDWGD